MVKLRNGSLHWSQFKNTIQTVYRNMHITKINIAICNTPLLYMPTLDDLLKNFHDELPKLIQMAHAEPGERFLDIEVAELRCSETYHL